MKNNLKPIGIFDSGLGGLTLLNALKKDFPSESFIYFGDTAHLPYGSKSEQTIRLYSKKIVEFLLLQDVKLIIVACNTASSLASKYLKEKFNIPIIEVITPCVDNVLRQTKNNRVGIIGTYATINSKVYSKLINTLNKNITTIEVACPLLVPIIEEGWHLKKSSNLILTEYMLPLIKYKIDTLILGCTHYSIIENDITECFNSKINLITSANSICSLMRNILNKNNLYNKKRVMLDKYFVTDIGQNFKEQAQKLLEITSLNISRIDPL